MKQIDKKLILNKAKEEKRRTRANFNFDSEAYEPFIRKCEKEDVTVTRILEEFMKEWVK